jgi:hypothetical protein
VSGWQTIAILLFGVVVLLTGLLIYRKLASHDAPPPTQMVTDSVLDRIPTQSKKSVFWKRSPETLTNELIAVIQSN